MAAELSLADKHTDELRRITLITSAARTTGLTPKECDRLDDLITLAEASANEIAAMYRVTNALMRVGRTEHTTELVRSVLRRTGQTKRAAAAANRRGPSPEELTPKG